MVVKIDNILSRNTHALVLCRAAQYDYSILLLDQALSELERLYLSDENDEDSVVDDDDEWDRDDDDHDCGMSEASDDDVVFPSEPHAIPLGPVVRKRLQQGTLSLYNNFFAIAPLEDDHAMDNLVLTEEVCNQLASLLHYNKALCLHLWALATGKDQILAEAAHTYQLALGGMAIVDTMMDEHPALTLLELAILNNSAQIHSDGLMVWHELEACADRIDTLLRGLDSEGYVQFDKHFSFFSKNVRTTCLQTYPRPAAAA